MNRVLLLTMLLSKSKYALIIRNEAVLTAFLWLLFLVQFAFDKHDPSLTLVDLIFTCNYVLASIFINLFLVPRLFYKARYWEFLLLFLLVVIGAMLIEELVLEVWFYSDTRGDFFNPYYAIIDVGATLAIFVGFKFGYDAWKRQTMINQLEKEKSASQLDHLKNQISPHFLFNNLNNLYSKALEGDKETPALIHRLARIMRYMLYESDDNLVPLKKEIEHMSDYIALQQLQIEGRGVVDFRVSGVEDESLKIAPLLIIGFIENSFKHSFSELTSGIKIVIHLNVEKDQLFLHCSNPFSEGDEKVHDDLPKGIGLKNIQSRLALLYPDQHKLEIRKEEGYFIVDLQLTLQA